MTEAEQKINSFLVDVFNDVLRLEEDDLARGPYKNLSVSEMHVLEAVDSAAGGETMRELAARLRVTASTLTVAVKTLEQEIGAGSFESETYAAALHKNMIQKREKHA